MHDCENMGRSTWVLTPGLELDRIRISEARDVLVIEESRKVPLVSLEVESRLTDRVVKCV